MTVTAAPTAPIAARSLGEQLAERRRELADELAQDMAEVALPPDDRGEDLTRSQHPADVASDLDQRERLVAQITAERMRLASVDDALARLGTGTYGTCTDCDAPIPLERLAALAQAARCIDCQRRHERDRRGRAHR